MMGWIKSEKYKSEIPRLGEGKISLMHGGALAEYEGDQDIWYTVRGTVYQAKNNSRLKFEKIFEKYADASDYLREMADLYPISEIILIKETKQELMHYV